MLIGLGNIISKFKLKFLISGMKMLVKDNMTKRMFKDIKMITYYNYSSDRSVIAIAGLVISHYRDNSDFPKGPF